MTGPDGGPSPSAPAGRLQQRLTVLLRSRRRAEAPDAQPSLWRRTAQVAPDEPATVSAGEQVLLTEFTTGPLATSSRPDLWVTGAAYERRQLLPASQRKRGEGRDRVVAADPQQLPRPRHGAQRAEELRGTWLYGGHWMPPFGHFVTETLANLWPEPGELGPLDGLVFHRWLSRDSGVAPWQRELVDLTGYAGLPIHVVDRDRVRLERMRLPTRPVVLGRRIGDEAVSVWDRVARGVAQPDPVDRVFLSRSSFNSRRRRSGDRTRSTEQRDQVVDSDFREAGFEVVFPEELTVVEQVRLAAGATVLAGAAGSALHLSAFAGPSTRIVEVGDARSPHRHLPHQLLIEQARGHQHAFVPHGQRPAEILRRLGLA